MTSVTLTGASGFIGREVAVALKVAGMHPICVSRATREGMFKVADYRSSPVADILIHLAEERDRVRSTAAGPDYIDRMTETTAALCGRGYGRIIYVSSAVVYGDRITTARQENEPAEPGDLYSTAKLVCERLVTKAGGTVVRLANVFGPGMASSNVLYTILTQVGQRGPMQVRDISPIRDYVWIDDVTAALVALTLGPASGVYNVGSGRGTSVGELAGLALKLAGEEGRKIISTESASTGSCCYLNIDRMQREFHWSARMDLPQGIRRMIQNHAIAAKNS